MKKQVRNIAIAGTATAIAIFGFVIPKTNAQNNEAMYRSYVEETTDENGNPIEEVHIMKLENEKEISSGGKDKEGTKEKESPKIDTKTKEKKSPEKEKLNKKVEEKESTSKKVSLKEEKIKPIMFSRAMHFEDYDKAVPVEETLEVAEETPEEADQEVADAEASAEDYYEVEVPVEEDETETND